MIETALRYFPLLGRPRPDCPALPLRIAEVEDHATSTGPDPAGRLRDAANALNLAALIASDAGEADLARRWCRTAIDSYLGLDRDLSAREAHHLLEPVLNLARLKIRIDNGRPALALLLAMHQAVTDRTDLTVHGRVLPLESLAATPAERFKVRQWTWLTLLAEGVRTLALASRWDDAADLARTYNGIGGHLMEGRQAVIIEALHAGDLDKSRLLLASATPTYPWEHQIYGCLDLLTTSLDAPQRPERIATAIRLHATGSGLPANYTSYQSRLGLAIAILTTPTQPERAAQLHQRLARISITAGDGYAARDILKHPDQHGVLTSEYHAALESVVRASGLGTGLPAAPLDTLTAAVNTAAAALAETLRSGPVLRASPIAT